MKGKKANEMMGETVKWMLVLALLLVLFISLGLITGTLGNLWDKILSLFRFG